MRALLEALMGALLLSEPVTPAFLFGGVVVIAGVYIGALSKS